MNIVASGPLCLVEEYCTDEVTVTKDTDNLVYIHLRGMSTVDKSRSYQRAARGWDPVKAAKCKRLAASVGGTKAARIVQSTKPFIITPWRPKPPDFIPGVRRPRADRPRRRT